MIPKSMAKGNNRNVMDSSGFLRFTLKATGKVYFKHMGRKS